MKGVVSGRNMTSSSTMITKHLGHESVGTVVSALPGSNYKVGDRVIIFQGDHCGQCHACRHALSPTYCQSNNPDSLYESIITPFHLHTFFIIEIKFFMIEITCMSNWIA